MPRKRILTREEKMVLREEIARRAACGDLRLPGAIKDMRVALGLTQEQFAQHFGLTRIQVIALEKSRANPTLETLERIGRVFGFTIGYVPVAEERKSIEGLPRATKTS